jgi:hypothetical protein
VGHHPWDELAHDDDAGTSLQPSASAPGPFGPMPALTQHWEATRTEALEMERNTPSA